MGVHPGCPVCLIVVASLVAVETGVGETISATKVAFVCGLWSVRVVTLLSAGPSSCFCIHQLLFPCLEVLVQGASPHHVVGCKVLPGNGVDVKSENHTQIHKKTRKALPFEAVTGTHHLFIVGVCGTLWILDNRQEMTDQTSCNRESNSVTLLGQEGVTPHQPVRLHPGSGVFNSM